ncbi:hypothetical protein B6R96_00165 [Streptomyces sp. Sge12]|nr:hypothetical protein B6R96_00165 [Streptomyces sp. Sge12]
MWLSGPAPDELWVRFQRVVPSTEAIRPQGGGRRRAGDREALAATIFVTTSGCTWRQLPPAFGPSRQTVYRRSAQWSQARVWTGLHRVVRTNSAPTASWTGRDARSTRSACDAPCCLPPPLPVAGR